jgi:hypothetical protein
LDSGFAELVESAGTDWAFMLSQHGVMVSVTRFAVPIADVLAKLDQACDRIPVTILAAPTGCGGASSSSPPAAAD